MTKGELIKSAFHAFINDVFSDPATAVKYALNCDINNEFRDFSERLARMGCTVCYANGIHDHEDNCSDKYGCPGCIKLLQSEVDTEFEILLREFFVKLRGECE